MATFTTNGGIKKIATGDESGTWGTSTNTNFDIIDRLTNGVVSITLTGATETVTTSNGTVSDGMSKVLVFGGTPGVDVTVTVAPNDAQKVYFIKNDCGNTITISQGTGASVDILDGSSSIVYCDGAGAGAAVVEITAGSSATNTFDVTSFTATSGQTSFSVTYTVGNIQVYQNGVLLKDTTDYTATNGTSVVLVAGATTGDSVDVVSYATFEVTSAYTKAQSDSRYAQSANNLSDLSSAATALSNLGVTATAAELNLLDGVTATTAELNYNDITTLGTSEASKAVTADANGNVTLSEEVQATAYLETVVALSGTTPTVDCDEGNSFTLSTTGNTTFTFDYSGVNLTTNDSYGFTLKVTAGGTHTLTWPASVDWPGGTAPDAPASGETDVFVFYTVDGGTNWYGFQAGDALA